MGTKKKYDENVPLSELGNQSSWQDNRDRIIGGLAERQPSAQSPVQANMGFTPEIYTQEQANAARKYNEGLRNQVQEKGNFAPGYMTGNPIDLRENNVVKKDTSWQDNRDNIISDIASKQPPQQPVTQQPQQQSLSGLNPNASKLNDNPDTTGWEGSDIAKANHFSNYGNKWNPSMNTPGLTSFDIPKPQAVQQPQSLKTIQNTQPLQNTQVIRNGQLLNQSFTSDGNGGYNSRMYDAAGNELTRADQEQMRMMASAQRLIDASMPAWNASSRYANEQATRAMNAMSGLKAIPTVSDVQKDAAAIRKMDTDTEIAPGLANADIGLKGAQANRYNVESQYMPQRFSMEKHSHNMDNNYKQAQIDNLNRKQGMTGRDLAALEKVELDRRIAFNEAYNSAVMNNPKIDKGSLRRDLERQFGLNKAQRRSATEFTN